MYFLKLQSYTLKLWPGCNCNFCKTRRGIIMGETIIFDQLVFFIRGKLFESFSCESKQSLEKLSHVVEEGFVQFLSMHIGI